MGMMACAVWFYDYAVFASCSILLLEQRAVEEPNNIEMEMIDLNFYPPLHVR